VDPREVAVAGLDELDGRNLFVFFIASVGNREKEYEKEKAIAERWSELIFYCIVRMNAYAFDRLISGI